MSMKLLALDLDGTVFGDDLVITDRMRAAIRAAQDMGVIVTIATGRMFRSARQIAVELGIHAPLICYQGALVRDSDTGETYYHKTVPIEVTHRVIDETNSRGLHLNVYLNDELYVAQVNDQARFYAQINMDLPINEVGDMHAFLDAQGGAEPTKLVIVTNPEETDRVLATFTALFGGETQVTKSHARFTELTNRDCSKGRALSVLAQRSGATREEVIAIGDGLNDLDMIEWAGYGVAMATSPQVVLDAARVVCPPLTEDGAACAIEHYILGRPVAEGALREREVRPAAP